MFPSRAIVGMLQKPLNEWKLWRGKLQSAPPSKLVQRPPMVLPEIRTTIGGTKPPSEPIWDEIRRGYEQKSAEYWRGVKKREEEYRLKESATPPYPYPYPYHRREESTTPPYRRMCQGCM